MRAWLLIGIVGIMCLTGACGYTFTMTKNGLGAHFHSSSQAKYDMLCASGDLEKVLASIQMRREIKDALYKYSCSDERSREKVLQIYASMTVQERQDIKKTFRKEGYIINYRPC